MLPSLPRSRFLDVTSKKRLRGRLHATRICHKNLSHNKKQKEQMSKKTQQLLDEQQQTLLEINYTKCKQQDKNKALARVVITHFTLVIVCVSSTGTFIKPWISSCNRSTRLMSGIFSLSGKFSLPTRGTIHGDAWPGAWRTLCQSFHRGITWQCIRPALGFLLYFGQGFTRCKNEPGAFRTRSSGQA